MEVVLYGQVVLAATTGPEVATTPAPASPDQRPTDSTARDSPAEAPADPAAADAAPDARGDTDPGASNTTDPQLL